MHPKDLRSMRIIYRPAATAGFYKVLYVVLKSGRSDGSIFFRRLHRHYNLPQKEKNLLVT